MAKKKAPQPKKKTKKTKQMSKSPLKKKSNAKSSKKKKQKKRVPNRYNQIQKILSTYCRERGLQLGRDFNRVASAINENTRDKPLKYVEQNIDAIYNEYFGKPTEPTEFPESIPFYLFNEVILTEVFNASQIVIKMDDGIEKFESSGDSLEVIKYFKSSGMYHYCRKYYDESPVATFVLQSVVGSVVEYKVETYYKPTPPSETTTKPIGSDIGTEKPSEVNPFTAEQIIAIEKEKQKTLKQAEKLMKQGWTKEEIFKLLGK